VSRASNVAWLERLSPWPKDGFGTERMRALVLELGQPQAGLPAVHVVGTNGKSTTTRMVEELLRTNGVSAGAYLSPHVRSWSERIRVAGAEVDLEAVLESVRPAAERLDATQFETLTAAAFVAFREAEVEAAAVEAGLGGRHDATNVLDATRVVVLTNVSLEHTEVLGSTREAIAAEKLAVTHPGCAVVVGEAEWEEAALDAGAGQVVVEEGGTAALAAAAASAFLGRAVDPATLEDVALPGRLERRHGEIRDGAHNPAGIRWLAERLPPDDYTVMSSILSDKDVDAMLSGLAGLGTRFVACRSSNARALAADELAARARRWFQRVEARDDPREAPPSPTSSVSRSS
jgi:dihydrofolate synthase/folylpolyglutamate synthase